ncbi:MAG: DUF4342 domain-containing protein [Ardenticatenaceae bacterium]|nr:DUF4342 domain-containing protein [Anaerolineales bacterium]MCB8941129.1 DUF4342 domain-containing protein [Ardenticatenaceae bacterium]MCB8972470.1 DUF4342 domain-containing protein [Ardenticatenaceae bacterium]
MAKKKEETVEEVEMAEEVVIEEEDLAGEEAGESWTQEFVAAGEELVNMVKSLMHETAVRRVVVKNEARNIHLSLPLAVGLPGIALAILWAPFIAAVAVVGALAIDCTITVERVAEEKEPEVTLAAE